MKCELLHACHLPVADGVLDNDGAVMVEILVSGTNGGSPIDVWQAGDPWRQRLMEPCVRLPGMKRVYGWHSPEGVEIRRHRPLCVVGVIRNYCKSEPIVAGGGVLDIVLSQEVPEHLRALYEYANSQGMLEWDDD